MTDAKKETPEEEEEQNQSLLHDLHRMYPAPTKVEETLANIQQRLFHSTDEVLPASTSTQPTIMAPRTQQTKGNQMNTNRLGWQRRFSALAAALIAALVVGMLLLVLNQARQTSTGRPTTPLKQSGGVQSLHMLDAKTGWAMAGNAVLHTIDGAASWQDVTPPGHAFGTESTVEFLTASLAWIALPQADQTTTIFHTSDSGRHWQVSTIQAPVVKQVSFIDDQHGWLLSGQENTTEAPAETVQVWRTTDSGHTWQSVATALFSDTTPPGQLPPGGQKSGISFLDRSTGWVTGMATASDLALLYVTHDGGKTWYQQTLPRPQGVPAAQLSILAPSFFSATNGLLPVRLIDLTTGRGIATNIYVTRDGGTTWQPTVPVSLALAASSFLDMQQGWVTDGSGLFVTNDGGQHWAKLAASPSFKNVTQLDFVSDTTGWAISGQGLLKTGDGGHTWSTMNLATS